MQSVSYSCPYCHATIRRQADRSTVELVCSYCQSALNPAEKAVDGTWLRRCMVCSSSDLFVRKDFPQRLGVTIVVLGIAASCVAWYKYNVWLTFGILFATALLDVVLFLFVGNLLECYRCHAQYRGFSELEGHSPFQLEVHERYRQQAARRKDSPRAKSAAK